MLLRLGGQPFFHHLNAALGFDARGQPELAVSVQQVDLPNLLEIQAHRIFRKLDRDGRIFQYLQRVFQRDFRPAFAWLHQWFFGFVLYH